MLPRIFFLFFGCFFFAEAERDEASIKSFCSPFKPGSEKCEIMINLDDLKKDCGEVCDTTIKPVSDGKYYDVIEKKFDCINLFESPSIDKRQNTSINVNKVPLGYVDLPKRIRDLYTYQGRVTVRDNYFNDGADPSNHPVWSVAMINRFRMFIRQGSPFSNYGQDAGQEVFRHLRDHMSDVIQGGNILVIGSQTPWIEAMLIELGVGKVTTVDYAPIDNHHPLIETLTPEELSDKFLNPPSVQFDGIVTYSSVEHSGLGRYGDALNPWGDLISMAKAWCLTKPGGKLLLGVPTGFDAVFFNSHRLYGAIQFSHLFANWKVVYTEAELFKDGIRTKQEDAPCDPMSMCYQPVHVLEKEAAIKETVP